MKTQRKQMEEMLALIPNKDSEFAQAKIKEAILRLSQAVDNIIYHVS